MGMRDKKIEEKSNMMFPADYLRAAGYAKLSETLSDMDSFWANPEWKSMPFDDACAAVMGRCTCCGKANSYPGGIRCGAACTARHEFKDCRCYAEKRKPELVKG